jgi:excisionase family DNA binding protein
MVTLESEVRASPELLTSRQVATLLAMSTRTLYRLVAAGKFPQPVRYNRKLVRWKGSEVMRYIESLG